MTRMGNYNFGELSPMCFQDYQRMKQTKLLRVLEKITTSSVDGVLVVDKAAMRDIGRFLASPFFNTNPLITKLFDWLGGFAPLYDETAMDEAALFQLLFPEENFEEAKLRKLRSKLLKLLENYVYVKACTEDEFQQNLSLLRFYDKENLLHDFDLHASKMEQIHLLRPTMDIGFFRELYLLEDTISRMKSAKEDDFVTDVNFQTASDSLDLFYLTQKLMYSSLMVNRAKILGGRYHFDYGLLEHILPAISKIMDKQAGYANMLELWTQTYQLLVSSSEAETLQHYQKLKAKVLELSERLSASDLLMLTLFLLNNVKKCFTDKAQRYEEQFEWHRFLVENKVYNRGAVLTPGMFKNIVTLALLVGKPDWASSFMDAYERILPEADTGRRLCRAMLLFEMREYAAVLDLLEGPGSVPQDTPYNQIIERRIRLKTYFEQNDDARFEAMHVSFSTWLSRNQQSISPAYLEANRIFLVLINDLYKSKYIPQQDKLAAVQSKALAMNELPEWKWLLKKAEEMGNSQHG